MIKIMLNHHFEAAHRLVFHQGKCRNLHGHRWDVKITLEGLPNIATGIIVDFGELKELINTKFDHATILSNDKENLALIELLESMGLKMIVIDKEPTVENMIMQLMDVIWEKFYNKITYVKIELWESPISKAIKEQYWMERSTYEIVDK